jgi:hypothetical protein
VARRITPLIRQVAATSDKKVLDLRKARVIAALHQCVFVRRIAAEAGGTALTEVLSSGGKAR